MKNIVGIVAVVFAFNAMSALAKPPTINLNCGKLPNYKVESERAYLSKTAGGGDNGLYNVLVTFIAKKPSNKQIDKILRECLAKAIKLDNSKDILATALYRQKQDANPYDDESLDIYGFLKYLSYRASTKSISVQSIKLGKK